MIGIYYIATNEYTQFADGFLDTIKYFMPDEDKHIILLGTKELKKYAGDNIDFIEITHYPWPIVSMYKFFLIQQHKISGVDSHFIFNANTLFCNTNFDFEIFKQDKIVVTQHAAFDSTCKNYIQGCVICIPDNVFDSFCEEHSRRVNYYMQKEHKVPIWHDETVLNEMLLRDNLFQFLWFPIDKGIRWQWYDGSPYPRKGLCYLRNKEFQQQFKNNY